MAGYNDGWVSNNGELIDVALFANEYSNIGLAFDAASGHKHDGTATEGAYIPVIHNDLNEVSCNISFDRIDFSTNVGAVKTLQLKVIDGAIMPELTNDIDLGSAGVKFKDAFTTSLTLGAGSTASSILDEDTLSSDSDTALATQQSIKAYVDNNIGSSSIIQSPDTFNAVELSGTSALISTNVLGVKTSQLIINAAGILPTTGSQMDLGTAIVPFKDAHADTVNATTVNATTIDGSTIDGGTY